MITTRNAALAAGAAVFCVVAILNSSGYRYGIGDQAFYIPSVVQHLNPDLFPRDRALLHVQDRLMLFDDLAARLVTATRLSLPQLFFVGYVASLLLLFAGTVSIGRTMYRSGWPLALALTLLTLRHRITQTGANTLEAYFHPRSLAFGLGACALAACLRGRSAIAIALVGAAFAVHPTTAVWFGVWLGVALIVDETRFRLPALIAGGVAAALGAWAVTAGPLRGRLGTMDPLWASALEGKDYIFPSDWDAAFWIVNLGYLAVCVAIYQMRRRQGVALDMERGIVFGAAALVLLFLVSWPLMESRVVLALQLQTSRIFWMLDFLTTIYVAWLLAEAPRNATVRRAVVALFVILAVGRGLYVWRVEHPGNLLVRVGLPQDEWIDAMQWIARTPPDTRVLAAPGHAWLYGTSVRVAGERDVYLEEAKDSAVALYSRDVALETLRRIKDLPNFETMTAGELQSLATRYDLDYVVADRAVDLPIAYRNQQFRIYRFRQ